MPAKLLHEIIPLTKNDCFTIFSRTKEKFDFPLHSHEEFELNFIQHAKMPNVLLVTILKK
jgi:hypothetical protein